MTEFWVSQAKHWCEYCRIYIGGSKQSIAFHEAGKKHKEIVALSLKDMRMRGRERRQADSELSRELAKIERNAMKDYMAQDAPGHPPAGKPPPVVPADRAARMAELEARLSADKLARATAAETSGAVLPQGWRVLTNPDGQVYYEHEQTGAIQWDAPGGGAGEVTGGGGSASSNGGARVPMAHGGWEQGWTEQGASYYYHMERGITQWQEPPEWIAAATAAASASDHMPAAATAATTTTTGSPAPKSEEPGSNADRQQFAPATTAAPPAASGVGAAEAAGASSSGGGSSDAGSGAPLDATTGLGAWTMVEEESMPEGGWGYEKRGEKRQKVAWATNRKQVEQEEEAERVEDLQARFAVPEDIKDALARQEAVEAAAKEAAEAAAAGQAVFAKRKGAAARSHIRKK